MTIEQLKQKIEQNDIDDILSHPLVMKYIDCKYICEQYVDAIAAKNNLIKIYIDDLNDMSTDNDFFESSASYLYIYDVEDLDQNINIEIDHLVIICNKIAKGLDVDFVEIPELLAWQIEDFIKSRVPGLTSDQVKWLCQIAKYNVYRLVNESEKLAIFPESDQRALFDQMNREDCFCDLNSSTIIDFTSAITKRDTKTIIDILKNISYIDIEPIGVASILQKQFLAQLECKYAAAWDKSMGSTEKQFNFLKRNSLFTKNKALEIYKLLTEIDYKLKSGLLPEDCIISYVLSHILN